MHDRTRNRSRAAGSPSRSRDRPRQARASRRGRAAERESPAAPAEPDARSERAAPGTPAEPVAPVAALPRRGTPWQARQSGSFASSQTSVRHGQWKTRYCVLQSRKDIALGEGIGDHLELLLRPLRRKPNDLDEDELEIVEEHLELRVLGGRGIQEETGRRQQVA